MTTIDRINKIDKYFLSFNKDNKLYLNIPKSWDSFSKKSESFNIITKIHSIDGNFIHYELSGSGNIDEVLDIASKIISFYEEYAEKTEFFKVKVKELADIFDVTPLKTLKRLIFKYPKTNINNKVNEGDEKSNNKVVTSEKPKEIPAPQKPEIRTISEGSVPKKNK